jgi:aldehyde:ferredoxin oxidoreductase
MQPILTVDLTNRKTSRLDIPKEWERAYLGGASLAARILYDHLVPELDPLSPQAPLLFLNGPLSGTAGPAVGRYVVCGRSPATKLWGESNCGGFWGVELRKTGFDGLMIVGKASEPIYLWINDGEVSIEPAEHLTGLDTYQTQDSILDEIGIPGTRVACIGPAGEALIPFALILSDHGRVAGRTGMGAVMGSKNLKAVAVKGSGTITVSDPPRYNGFRSAINRQLRDDPVTKIARELGTASVGDYFNYLMEMPKKYFTRGQFKDDLKISGTNIKNSILAGVSACHACVIACGRVVKLRDGKNRKGAEYETLAGFGPNLLIDDPERITMFGELCDRYGMDTISLSNIIGFAMALYESGIIQESDTDGMAIEWGNADVVGKLIHLTAKKEGIGKYLALGARDLGSHFNAADQAVQVNGLEIAYHDPRGATGMGLVYATSPRGACHNQSDYYLVEIGQCYPSIGLDYYSPRGGTEKVRNVARHQDWRTLFNSLVMCIFSNVPPEDVLNLINSACGLDWSIEDMMKAGERGWNLKRVINNRFGLTREFDKLPNALLVPYEDDPTGFVLEFESMLDAYYDVRDWDNQTGIPHLEKLTELELAWVSEDLLSFMKAPTQ